MLLEGFVDSCQGGCIFGWVWDREHQDQRQVVEISLDITPLCRLTAAEHRKDLLDSGVGDGAYGFLYKHPALTYEATGYMAGWPDGRAFAPEPDTREHMPSHDAGMVGFIKQLVDEIQAMPQETPRRSRFDSLTLQWGICVIRKAGRPEGPLFD